MASYLQRLPGHAHSGRYRRQPTQGEGDDAFSPTSRRSRYATAQQAGMKYVSDSSDRLSNGCHHTARSGQAP
jgi:hypothetical protein